MNRHQLEIQYAARQELARRKLNYYVEFMAGLSPARHHQFLNSHLEAVERGEIKRLMVFMPPGFAKSTYCSVYLPGWFIGRNPKKSIISASYGQGLAERFGGKVRDQINSKHYPFEGVTLSPKTNAKGEWETNHGGEYYAGSVGAGITGRRSDLGIIDDPVKGREDADSVTIRNKTWEWYRSDFLTRLKPDGAVIIILTRWHEDDLVGRILYWNDNDGCAKIPAEYDYSKGYIYAADGEKWNIVSLPAIAEEDDQLGREPGETLWPDYFSPERLKQIQLTQGSRNWNSLFQQKPRPEEGSYFELGWIKRYHYEDLSLEDKRFWGASDYAVGEKEENDETVHGIAALNPADDIYIVDLWHGKHLSDVWAQQQIDLIKKWKPIQWAAEKGQIEKAVGPFLKKMLREQKVYCHIKGYPSTSDKQQRAQSIRARCAQGKLYIPYGEWGDWLVRQMLSFPSGVHDDAVDFLSKLGQMLDKMVGPQTLEKVDETPKEKYIFGVKQDNKKDFRAFW